MFNYLKLFTIVPEKHLVLVERLGKFHRKLHPGLNFMIPFFDYMAYKHSLKEQAIQIDQQTAITKDNVTLHLDGVLFIRIYDPIQASYKIQDPKQSVKLLALTLMRSEIGKMKLDTLFQERSQLNKAIIEKIAATTKEWGVECLRYEILNIDPPDEIKKSMQSEAEAERQKRRYILTSEGRMTAEINIASGYKQAQILQAEGESESINVITQSESKFLELISNSLNNRDKQKVINYMLLQNYLTNYTNILKNSKVVVAPENSSKNHENDLMSLAAMLMFNTNSQKQTSDGLSQQKQEDILSTPMQQFMQDKIPVETNTKYKVKTQTTK